MKGHLGFVLLCNFFLTRYSKTQNIDGLEAVAGVDPDKMVEAHGHFRAAKCIDCGMAHEAEDCKSSMLEEGKAPKCTSCNGRVKPSIVFFGEVMPSRFMDLIDMDVAEADLVIVLGTSLLVAPVASIPDWVKSDCPRILINRELVGSLAYGGKKTDVFMEGDCDERVRQLCQLVGWEKHLDALYKETHAK